MAPPELTGNTPVACAAHPVHIILGKALGNEFNLALFNAFNCGNCKRFHTNEPLLGNHGLNARMAAVAGSDLVLERLDFLDKAACFEVFEYSLSRFFCGHTGILAAVENLRLIHGVLLAGIAYCVCLRLFLCAGKMSVIGEGAYDRQIVAKPYLKVVGVVSGSNFNYARTLRHIGMLVADYRNFLVDKRQDYVTAVKVLVSLIICVDGNGGIAEHSLGTGGRKLKLLARFLNRIEKMPEMRILLLILNLSVGNRGVAVRTPVNHTVALINQILIIKSYENFLNGVAAALVKSEAFPVPVAGRAHFLKLLDNSAAVLLLPCPGALKELVSAEILLGDAFLAHGFNYLSLGGYRRVVGAGKPQSIVTRHSVITDKNVLKRIVKRVTHVKLARDVGRRNDYCVSLFALLTLGVEVFVGNPFIINTLFNVFRVVLFFKFLFHISLLKKSCFCNKKRPIQSMRRNNPRYHSNCLNDLLKPLTQAIVSA